MQINGYEPCLTTFYFSFGMNWIKWNLNVCLHFNHC